MRLSPDIVDFLRSAEKTASSKSLAVPNSGRPPTFNQVATVVLSGVQCRMPTGVLCLTQQAMAEWLDWPALLAPSIAAFDLLDLNEAPLTDWQPFLSRQSYGLTVLHGACLELATGRLSVHYVMALVNAVPSGLVVVA